MAVFTVPVWKELPCTLALPLLFWTWLAGPRRPLNLVKDKLAEQLDGVNVIVSSVDRDPLQIV